MPPRNTTTSHDPTPNRTDPSPPTTTESNTTITDDSTCAYQCSYCSEQYDTIAVTRTHISLSETDAHKNRNGFMPESEVHVIDTGTNDRIDTVTTRPRDWNLQHDVTPQSLPDTYSTRDAVILTAAVRNHVNHDIQEITTAANTIATHLDCDVNVSYQQTRRAIRRILTPNMNPETTSDVDSLSDVTTIQQAIILADLAHPDKTQTAISELLNISKSYPTQVLSKYERVSESVTNALESYSTDTPTERREALTDVLRSELSADAITALHDAGHLDAINIPTAEVEEVLDDSDTQPTDSEEHSAGADEPDSSVTDGPATTGILRAAPENTFENGDSDTRERDHTPDTPSTNSTGTGSNTTGVRDSAESVASDGSDVPGDSDTPETTTESSSSAAGDSDSDANPRIVADGDASIVEGMQQLRSKLTFFREVHQHSSVYAEGADVDVDELTVALADTVINDINIMLDEVEVKHAADAPPQQPVQSSS